MPINELCCRPIHIETSSIRNEQNLLSNWKKQKNVPKTLTHLLSFQCISNHLAVNYDVIAIIFKQFETKIKKNEFFP